MDVIFISMEKLTILEKMFTFVIPSKIWEKYNPSIRDDTLDIERFNCIIVCVESD